jgi:hypothetical protein
MLLDDLKQLWHTFSQETFMQHPLQSLTLSQRRKTFWSLLGTTLLLLVILNMVSAPLNTAAAPYGIISFEFARTQSAAQAMLASWDAAAQLHAAFSLGLDYLYMPLYATAIGLASILAAGVLRDKKMPLAGAGAWLAWALWLAAGFDALENVALLQVLFGSTAALYPALAFWCAAFKFTIIFIGLVYAFWGLIARNFKTLKVSKNL